MTRALRLQAAGAIALAAVLGLVTFAGSAEQAATTTYLFTYFTGNGEDGLHLARSDDGTRWRPVASGRSLLAPVVGSRLMRDPSVVFGPDGRYHLVWTTGWWDRGFGVAHSTDLKAWSTQSFVPVFEGDDGVQNVWAPEIHHDERTGRYLVVWASTITGRFPETAQTGDTRPGGRLNHRLYATTTTDFVTWTPARLFYDGGFNVIDGAIVRDAGRYVLVMKDETRYPQPRKHLRTAVSTRMEGPYGPASRPFSPAWVEGPTLLRLGDTWRIFYDEYTRKRYGAVDTRDFRRFTSVADLEFPPGMRHGTAFVVPRPVADALEP